MGLYYYGYEKNGPCIYIDRAMSRNFYLPHGEISEKSLSKFVMRSIGGVNGRNIRKGDRLMFRKADGRYTLVTYEPMCKGKRGYVREIKPYMSNRCLPLSALPNFDRLEMSAVSRAGDTFCVIRITPYENRGEDFDYACIAEFFDLLRREMTKPSVFWLGGREYAVMIKPCDFEKFSEICKKDLTVDGMKIKLSVSRVIIPAEATLTDQAQKLSFCTQKLRRGTVSGEYIFEESDFYTYRKYTVGKALERKICKVETGFLPAVSVGSGRVKYFYAFPKGKKFAEEAVFGGYAERLDSELLRRLTDMLRGGELPKAAYCLQLCGESIDEAAISELAHVAENKIYIEIRVRAARYEDSIAQKIAAIKRAGAVPVVYDPEAEVCSLAAMRRMGAEVIRLADKSREKLKAFCDFCRFYNIDCAFFGVELAEDFIELRRLGLDICAGGLFSGPIDIPEKTLFSLPVITYEKEEEEEEKAEEEVREFDLTRFAVKTVYGFCAEEMNELLYTKKRKPLDPMEKTDRTEKLLELEKLDGCELSHCEYEEGLGAKKKRKKAVSDRAQKRRQKKEIKKGRLKKEKKIKLEKK